MRDTLLHRRPNDWDVTTSASPADVMRTFKRTVPTGIKHGTVTVIIRSRAVEVTTYRVEGAYSDHRRPDSVRFTPSLAEDLARRDFTVNAMAMDASGAVTDLFGGREDLERRVIRCVGNARARFTEDALRMLRAVRFAAKLGFEIEPATLESIAECAGLAASLSAERVAGEIRGILASPRPDLVWELVDYGLLDNYLRAGDGRRESLGALPQYARWAHWCAALESGGNIMSTERFLRSLRLDNRTVKTVSAAAEILKTGSRDYKRLLRRHGRDAVLAAYPKSRKLREILRSGECWSLDTLAIRGADVAALGLSGRELGEKLQSALDYVIERPECNQRELLCKLIVEGKM